uniref:WD_REPEATS_REGION domain-containing protein n=1 Tax=Steinernema glaseri TaxID=37863 RepID=A0A1I7ZIY5_9BILA
MFAIASDRGVRRFNVKGLEQVMHLDFATVGSIKRVAIFDHSSLIAMQSGGTRPKFSQSSVVVWDDHQDRRGYFVDAVVKGDVTNFAMTKNKLVVFDANHLTVFDFDSCQKLCCVEISYNTDGVMALCTDPKSELLAYPGFQNGTVQLVNVGNITSTTSISPTAIQAHKSQVTQIALNMQGTMLATGSVKGTLIRVFDTARRNELFSFRRGFDTCSLYSLRFSPCLSFLAVSSDKGTIHVFELEKNDERLALDKNLFERISGSDASRSIAQFTLPAEAELAFGSLHDVRATQEITDDLSSSVSSTDFLENTRTSVSNVNAFNRLKNKSIIAIYKGWDFFMFSEPGKEWTFHENLYSSALEQFFFRPSV